MSRGFLIFAHNNEQLDYALVALCNALMIKSNLKENKVALVTDEYTKEWLISSRGEELVSRAFDQIIVAGWDNVYSGSSTRMFHDTLSTGHRLPWYNGSRVDAYALSPFDETILLDCDYLVCDRTFDLVWGGDDDIMINRSAKTLEGALPHENERWLDRFSIPLYWATAVYFRKGERAKMLFDLVEHVRERYAFYQYVYDFKGTIYRNDYAFSIAVHLLGGFQPEPVSPLPSSTILTSFDCDELIDVPSKNALTFLINDGADRWRFRVGKVHGVNVHVMNKFSIVRQAQKIIDIYGGAQ